MTSEPGVDRWETICRECAETGADVLGNDGWMRHEECARDLNQWPHVEHPGVNEVLGASVRVYKGGDVSVVPSLRNITARLGVTQLADRLGNIDEDYDTLNPEVAARV